MAILLDLLRPEVLKTLAPGTRFDDGQLHVYWSVLHTMAHLILLAAEEGARSWLIEMANDFTWIVWTPTFALLRERTL